MPLLRCHPWRLPFSPWSPTDMRARPFLPFFYRSSLSSQKSIEYLGTYHRRCLLAETSVAGGATRTKGARFSMTTKSTCIRDLNEAIALTNQLKVDITRGQKQKAIDRIADILFTLGRTLTCINRLELAQLRRGKAASTTSSASTASQSIRALRATTKTITNKAECIRLADLAIVNFQKAKILIQLGRYEDAENTIAAGLTGRILRCVNHLRV